MKIAYLSNSDLDRSVNAVYVKGLKENGVLVNQFFVKSGFINFIRTYWRYREDIKTSNLIIVGYDSPTLVIFLRLCFQKKIIYNALCSVYERLIVSRGLASRFSPKTLYYWLIDFVAVRLANLVMVETSNQIGYFVKLFKVRRGKLFRAWTGVDENKFFYNPSVQKFSKFTVIFRGALVPEAGAEYVVKAAKILEKEDVGFIMQSGGMLLSKIKKTIEDLKPTNLELISDFMSVDEMRQLMLKCHLSLGQLSDHPRLERTIPHKCYESLAMKLPYLTAANKGVLELLKDGETCITTKPANAEDLAAKIIWAKNNPQQTREISENGYKLFKEKLTSKVLAHYLLEAIKFL